MPQIQVNRQHYFLTRVWAVVCSRRLVDAVGSSTCVALRAGDYPLVTFSVSDLASLLPRSTP
jgi:hypothetical protein